MARCEEDWFHLLAAPPEPQRRSISLHGARILAGQLREAAERRRAAMAAARTGRGGGAGGCPLDLHRLVPVPEDVLRLGPDHPEARRWLWAHWGTTWALRHVVELPAPKAGQRLPVREPGRLRLGFWSADWTPWPALARLRRDWPALRFESAPALRCGLTGAARRRRGRAAEAGARDRSRAPRSANTGAPELRLGAWEGPLDLLLELARARRVDLARLSILDLAGQFGAAVQAARPAATHRSPASAIGWSWRRSWRCCARGCCCRRTAREGEEARREAEALRRRLADRAHARRLADWLEAAAATRARRLRARRGGGAAAAGMDRAVPTADIAALFRACLAVLERSDRGGSWRPEPLPLWRVPDALSRLRRMLPAAAGGRHAAGALPAGGCGRETPARRCGAGRRWPARCSPRWSSNAKAWR